MPAVVCPECRKTIPASAPAGQCPECLLKRGLERPGFASAAFAVTTPQGSRQIPLTSEFIAPYFPQMEILELLGQGGMGTVFKARQTKLDRMVAVKIIRPETASDPAFAERFMREAKTLARLSHPSIVSVHDFGEINLADANDGLPIAGASGSGAPSTGGTLFYFVMEYVDGANLRQLMQSGQMSPELTLGIIQQVCDALQFAHEESVVHRDIKPENIMLDSKGRVKIADFGLAKLADRSGIDWTLTGTHQVMGTPRYMAPEQLAGSRDVDHRADIYSLAVVFYEMLTGTIPIGHFAPPSKKVPVDVRLDEVVLRAMASEPEQRFQSAGELKSSVEKIAMSAGAYGQSNPSVAVMPGLSTMIDRGVAGAWRIMNGREPEVAVKRPSAPVLLLTILALIGAGSLFVMVGPMSASIANNVRNVNGENGVVMIGDRQLHVLSLILFGLCGSLLHIVPQASRSTSWTFGSLLLLASLLLLTLLLDVDRVIPMLLGLYAISIVCALTIALLSLAGLRRVLFPGEGQGRSVARTDSVVISREQLEQGILPDICMVSGQPTTNRQTISIHYQPKWAEAASFGGYVLGGIPGVIMHMLTSHKIHIPCPICEQHTGDRHHRNLYASIGWILIPLMGGFGALIGYLRFGNGETQAAIAVPLGFVGLFLYLMPVICMSWSVVHCEQNSDGKSTAGQISIRRVCTAFASEVRKRQASWKPRA